MESFLYFLLFFFIVYCMIGFIVMRKKSKNYPMTKKEKFIAIFTFPKLLLD